MLDSICQAYGWSFKDAMRLTMPQTIMLNFSAWVNQERSKRRCERERDKEKRRESKPLKESDIVHQGKSMDQMNSNELVNYVMNWEKGT